MDMRAHAFSVVALVLTGCGGGNQERAGASEQARGPVLLVPVADAGAAADGDGDAGAVPDYGRADASRMSCEQLQIQYAELYSHKREPCTRDQDCRCTKGGVVPIRLCGGVDGRLMSRMLDALTEEYLSRCDPRMCGGPTCAEKLCRTWSCTAVCTAGTCTNATGPNAL